MYARPRSDPSRRAVERPEAGGGRRYASRLNFDRHRDTGRGCNGLDPRPVGGCTRAAAAGTPGGDAGCGRRGPPPLRTDRAVPPPAVPAGPGRLRPRPVVEPVVVVPDGRGLGGRPGAPRPLSVLDLRLFGGRPDPVFGLAAAARPR